MSFCKKCGFRLDDDAQFCPQCGTPAVIVEEASGEAASQSSPPDSSQTLHKGKVLYGVVNVEKLPSGYVIDGRYEVIRKLGQGGFGAVYLALDRKMNIEKALKVIPEAVVNDLEAMEHLREEARTMVKLNHKHIVRVYDFHEEGEIKYIDMEYIDGESLTEVKLSSPEKKLSEEQVKGYALQIADGLGYAHSLGVIHRDIKPQNIMVNGKGEVKIMDFGIAETVRTSMSRVQSTSTTGTLLYMSPEQVLGTGVGRETDIYSLGIVMYELLTGHPPFNKGDITYQILHKEAGGVTGASASLNEVIRKCLSKDPHERIGSAEEFKALLKGESFIRKQGQSGAKKASLSPLLFKRALQGAGILAGVIILFLVIKAFLPQGEGPRFAPPSGTYEGEVIVELNAEPGTRIRYTIDGSEPTVSHGEIYTKKIVVERTMDIKAVSYTDEKHVSEVREAHYTLLTRNPEFSIKSGALTEVSHVKLSSEKGAVIRYTTDGSTPGEYEGKVYEAPVRIDGDVTLKAVAVREGKAPSKVSEASYKLGGRLVSPAADVKSRAFAERTPFTVRLSGPEGAEIRYTTDGSDPGPGRGRVYSTPVSLTPPVVLKAVSVKAGMRTSGVMSESYNINSVLMVKITGGTFRMGSNENSDEKPIHSVTVDSFWMGKFEVTQKEWQSVMGTNPSNFKGEDLPVENVSWYDTVKFCNKLSEQDGYDPVYTINGTQVTCDFTKNGYRLPTEAEWEYVARGGNQSRGYTYAGSNSAGTVAWYWDNSGKKTHPVGTKQPNELGLYDMSGNVWEWCWDRYDGNYYAQSPSKNPKGKSEGSYRVLRGGSWRFEEEYLQTTKRNYGDSSNTNNHRGFRLVRTSKNE